MIIMINRESFSNVLKMTVFFNLILINFDIVLVIFVCFISHIIRGEKKTLIL